MGDRVELAQFRGSCSARGEARQAVVRHWVGPKKTVGCAVEKTGDSCPLPIKQIVSTHEGGRK